MISCIRPSELQAEGQMNTKYKRAVQPLRMNLKENDVLGDRDSENANMMCHASGRCLSGCDDKLPNESLGV